MKIIFTNCFLTADLTHPSSYSYSSPKELQFLQNILLIFDESLVLTFTPLASSGSPNEGAR